MNNFLIFIDILSDYIEREGITVNKFSECVNLANGTVAKWFNRENYPTTVYAVRIANFFDCSLDFLFGLSNKEEYIKSENNEDFLVRFEKLRQIENVTAYAIAKACELQQSTISNWHRGKYPKVETLIKLARYFNCSLDFLVGRSDVK